MDPSSPQDDAEPKQRISALVSEFFDRRQAGENLTPESFATEHPDVAEELRPYLAGLPLIETACTLDSGSGAGEAAHAAAALPVVAGYDLIEEIGRGGMGVVYKALQVSTKRIVGLKVMLAGPFASPSARRRFEREVELAARLQHPSIARVLESGEVSGQPYYAMDYVTGVRLDRHLSAAQPDLRRTLSLFVQICEAVEYAHGHGVVHRDLKPANVLVDEQGNPHVLDFGLAKATDSVGTAEATPSYVSLEGQVLGTLFYLSPEQAAGTPAEIDARTDVYALGVMLFEALTGSLPFGGRGRPSEVIQRILEAAPTRPRSLSNQIDGELETIILKALEKEKQRRYQSAREMAEDIRRYLAAEPIRARRPSALYVLRKKLRKHRWRVGLAAAAVVLVAVGLLAEIWSRQQELADARRRAASYQRMLEAGGEVLGSAQALSARFPQLPEARLVYVQAQYRTEQREIGILFLERGLQHHPSRWADRALLAEIYRATGYVERADELQARAEREAPDTPEAWYLRSYATLDQQKALRCAQEAVRRQPSYALAWYRLTHLRQQAGDWEGALQGAEQLIQLWDDPYEWVFFKGQILARQGRFRQAVEHYTRLITMDPAGASAYRYRAHAYRRLREYPKALADYNRLLEGADAAAGGAWDLYQRATPLWILGRTDEALADYQRVRNLLGRPSYADARRFLILRQQGRTSEAQEILDAARRHVEKPWLEQIFRCLAGQITPDELVAAAPRNPEQLCEAYYYAGEVCLLSERPAAARKWFEQCVQTGLEFDPDAQFGTPMNEFELAQWRLASLFADNHPTSRP